MFILGVFCAGLLGYALLSRILDRRSLTPQLVLLGLGLLVGVVGSDASGWAVDLGLLHAVGEVALVLCLFVDAARIDVGALRSTAGLPLRLLAIGLPLTIVLGAIAAALVLPSISLLDAALVAVLVAPTDAALGAVVVTSPRVPRRVRQALNVESGLNDGLVTPLVLVLVVASSAEAGSGTTGWVADAARQIVVGVLAGAAAGISAAMLLRVALARRWMLPAATWITAPAIAFLAWVIAAAFGGNAFVAAFVAGLAVTATLGRVPAESLEFGEIGGELLGLVVFFLFGALLPTIGPFDLPVVVFAVLALTVVRIVPVALSLLGTHLAAPTIVFMGWFGPRGLASIVLAIIAIGDGAAGPPGFAAVVISAVSLTVVLSVLLHGLSAGPGVRAYAAAVDRLPDEAPEHGRAGDIHGRTRPMTARSTVTESSTMVDGLPSSEGASPP